MTCIDGTHHTTSYMVYTKAMLTYTVFVELGGSFIDLEYNEKGINSRDSNS